MLDLKTKLISSWRIKGRDSPSYSDLERLTGQSEYSRDISWQEKAVSGCLVMLLLLLFLVCLLSLSLCLHSHRGEGRLLHKAHHTDHTFMLEHKQALSSASPVIPSPESSLGAIMIAVKTSHKFHSTRLVPVVSTWFPLARDSTYFFTDKEDPGLSQATGGHTVNTQCGTDHTRQDLCCKMEAELQFFLDSEKSWFCHFDDDQYVNVLALDQKLRHFSSSSPWYLGKPSLEKPLQIGKSDEDKISFWFATGGAGFCISRSLATALSPLLEKEGGFSRLGDRMRLPDDVTMGFLIEHLANVRLVKVPEFHSHLEALKLVNDLEEQISFSYSPPEEPQENLLSIPDALFPVSEDPTRFYSLHCYLLPSTKWCSHKQIPFQPF